jgi:O-succinylbenzoate synthase
MGEERADYPSADIYASDADQVLRPISARDAEQVSRFVDIFREEVADLRHRLRDAERNWERRRSRSQHELDMPDALLRLREQLGTAEGLLVSLRNAPKRTDGAALRATGP